MNESQGEWMRRVWEYAITNEGYYSVHVMMAELLTNPDGAGEEDWYWERINTGNPDEACESIRCLHDSWQNGLGPEDAICALYQCGVKYGVI